MHPLQCRRFDAVQLLEVLLDVTEIVNIQVNNISKIDLLCFPV